MNFTRKYFNPSRQQSQAKLSSNSIAPGDRREGDVYVYNDEIILAVNVALAIRRPLLIEGPPGSGKSSLAKNVARELDWDYYEHVVTSRTRAQDILWEFDALRRLNDAQAHELSKDRKTYLEPGPLWWTFNPESARNVGESKGVPASIASNGKQGAVFLIDEVDKADPDVPNDLLVPLGRGEFYVKETDTTVQSKRNWLIVITSNGERVLAPAFVRRCVRLKLNHPDAEQLARIAKEHYGTTSSVLHHQLAEWFISERERMRDSDVRSPSTAEYLDAIRACRELGVTPDSPQWEKLAEIAIWKKEPNGKEFD